MAAKVHKTASSIRLLACTAWLRQRFLTLLRDGLAKDRPHHVSTMLHQHAFDMRHPANCGQHQNRQIKSCHGPVINCTTLPTSCLTVLSVCTGPWRFLSSWKTQVSRNSVPLSRARDRGGQRVAYLERASIQDSAAVRLFSCQRRGY